MRKKLTLNPRGINKIHRSEVDDINLGLEHFYGDFNVVHARLISSGVSGSGPFLWDFFSLRWLQIRDYEGLINHISHVLRPGGLIDIMEWDFHCYDEHFNRINLNTSTVSGPWWPRWLAFLEAAARNRGGAVDAASHIHDWVSHHPLFENVAYWEYYIPSSAWKTDSAFDMRIGQHMTDDILVCVFLRFSCLY